VLSYNAKTRAVLPVLSVAIVAVIGVVILATRRKPGGNVEIIRPDWMNAKPKAKGKASATRVLTPGTIPTHVVEVKQPTKKKAAPAATPPPPPVRTVSPAAKHKAAKALPAPQTPVLRSPAKASVAPSVQQAPPANALSQQSEPVATESATRKPTQAAQDLYTYATALIRGGHGDQLGNKSAPDETVRSAQRDMKGKLATDGIYGPKTMARGKELLGREFPARTSAARVAPPSARTAEQAASDLYNALSADAPIAAYGTKKAPNALVRAAQHDMGGGLVADGVYGPKTQARGAKLLLIAFPTRPA
jgi:peptidoglycan hydrolase-like protein with peptidoglycan-binding domain